MIDQPVFLERAIIQSGARLEIRRVNKLIYAVLTMPDGGKIITYSKLSEEAIFMVDGRLAGRIYVSKGPWHDTTAWELNTMLADKRNVSVTIDGAAYGISGSAFISADIRYDEPVEIDVETMVIINRRDPDPVIWLTPHNIAMESRLIDMYDSNVGRTVRKIASRPVIKNPEGTYDPAPESYAEKAWKYTVKLEGVGIELWETIQRTLDEKPEIMPLFK